MSSPLQTGSPLETARTALLAKLGTGRETSTSVRWTSIARLFAKVRTTQDLSAGFAELVKWGWMGETQQLAGEEIDAFEALLPEAVPQQLVAKGADFQDSPAGGDEVGEARRQEAKDALSISIRMTLILKAMVSSAQNGLTINPSAEDGRRLMEAFNAIPEAAFVALISRGDEGLEFQVTSYVSHVKTTLNVQEEVSLADAILGSEFSTRAAALIATYAFAMTTPAPTEGPVALLLIFSLFRTTLQGYGRSVGFSNASLKPVEFKRAKIEQSRRILGSFVASLSAKYQRKWEGVEEGESCSICGNVNHTTPQHAIVHGATRGGGYVSRGRGFPYTRGLNQNPRPFIPPPPTRQGT